MKLTRIMSLVLALVLAVSLFGSVIVSAADTAELKFVVKDGDKVVSGELEKNKVYALEIVLDNISTGKVAGVEFKLAYNKDVMKIVNASGADVSGAAAFVTELPARLTVSELVAPTAGDGVIAYMIAAPLTDLDAAANGVEVGNTFTVTKLYFKTIADGKIGVALHEDNKLNVAVPKKAEVTVIPSAERVGKIAYVSATADEAFEAAAVKVVGKSTAEEIIAELPATVNVTYIDEEGGNLVKEAAIVWAKAANFDADKVGEYEFVGTVTTPADINYKGAAVTVKAAVKIDTLKVQSVEAIADIVARVGDEVTLPATVAVEVTGGAKAELNVTWDKAVDTTAAGEFAFVGTIAGTDTIDADGKTAAVKVLVYAKSADTAPAVVDAVEVEAAIDAADIAVDAADALPAFVLVGETTKEYIDVTWVQTEDSKKDEYAIGDVLKFVPVAEGVTFPVDFVAVVTVSVPAGKETVTFEATEYTTEEIKNDAEYTLEKAIADAAFSGKYADGTAVDLSAIVWDKDAAAFDAETAGTYTLTGTWADVYGNEQTFTITIKIVEAGATDIAIYTSLASANPVTTLQMNAGDSRKIYAKLQPVGVVDTVTWATSKKSVVDLGVDATDSAAIVLKAKAAGSAEITATTSKGIVATVKVVVNSSSSNDTYYGPSAYKGNPAVGELLANAANEMEQQNIAKASVFGDLAGYEWAATQIETLRLLSVVSGKSNTAFAPADSVTRAEFLAMLVRLFGFQAKGEAKAFTDVPADAWYYNTVAVASSLGIAYGYENGAFDPNAVITRQDMAVFAERAIVVAGLNPARGIERAFNDGAEIAEYAKAPVSNMSAYGVINGMNDGTFAPAATANRAQAAVVAYNLYVLKNK